jgi:transcription elongation GreA/GreB family factor
VTDAITGDHVAVGDRVDLEMQFGETRVFRLVRPGD